MRFILPVVALFFLGFLGFGSCDLRFASTPKTGFVTRNRANSVAFTTKTVLYMEPATFGYAGLVNQRNNNYDNFLRSNIDNEQDNRNFNTEAGKDHLPFRTNEAKATDATGQLPAPLLVDPGKEYVLPLRWNNPHASELELNIWIQGNTIVVPIKKPVCAGEGYQDGVVSFIVPSDFNTAIGARVQGFSGCTKAGDCVLQMYAHSVEPRTYAAGTPLIVSGWDASLAKATANQVEAATTDPGTDLSKQPRETCLPSGDASSNIANAVPRLARQVSDVYNHAYQNSDYSPYSGQQHEAISKTMQAAGILRMVNGNRGELGQSILTQQQKNTLANLRNTADNVVKTYEAMTNKIINQILKNGAKTTATVAAGTTGKQQLNNCFRCKEAASVSANRLETNTYVPSFKIENAAQADAARQLIQNTQPALKNLINTQGVVNIYVQSLNAMAKQYADLQAKYGLGYQPARVKSGPGTMADPVQFKKINAAGQNDGGKYAATQAKAKLAAEGNGPIYPGAGTTTKNLNAGEEGGVQFFGIDEEAGENNILDLDLNTVLTTFSADASAQLSANADDDPAKQNDYHDVADDAEGLPITKTATAEEIAAANQQSSSSSSSSSGGMSTGMVAGIAGAGGALFAGLIAAGIIIKNKKQAETQQTNTRVFTDARV